MKSIVVERMLLSYRIAWSIIYWKNWVIYFAMHVFTLGAHMGTVVGLSVCLSGLYLAGRAFIRSTNDATYLAGNEVENICAILSETSPLQSLSPTGIVPLTSAAAILGTRLRTIFFEHVCAAAIFLWQRRRLVSCYFHCQSCLRARSVMSSCCVESV